MNAETLLPKAKMLERASLDPLLLLAGRESEAVRFPPGVIGEAGSGVAVPLPFLEEASIASAALTAAGEDPPLPFQLNSADGGADMGEPLADGSFEAAQRPYGLEIARNAACK